MEIAIISFGKIAELITIKKLEIDNIADTDELKNYLEKNYPDLNNMKYKLAVDRQIVQENCKLKDGSVVAIMPPFSGG
jgi:sulfur-carrier protein